MPIMSTDQPTTQWLFTPSKWLTTEGSVDEVSDKGSEYTCATGSESSQSSRGSIGSIIGTLSPPPLLVDVSPSENMLAQPSPPRKRTYTQQVTDSPTTSPQKKKPRFNDGPTKVTPPHSGLKKAKDKVVERLKGLLAFFTKATPEEYEEQKKRQFEDLRQSREEREWKQQKSWLSKKQDAKEAARQCQQKSRDLKKKREIAEGLRSPGGTKPRKRKVRCCIMIIATLAHIP